MCHNGAMRWLVLLVLAGCASPAEVGSTTADVVHGADADARGDAVVRLEITHPESGTKELCSGTLVAPNLVLTARHCVAVRDASRPSPTCTADGWTDTPDQAYVTDVAASGIDVIVGRSIAASAGTGVVGDAPAPSFGDAPVAAKGLRIVDDGSSAMCGHDVAVLVLDRALGSPTTSIRRTAPVVGESLTAIGWGRTQDGYPPSKQMRTGIPVLAIGAGLFTYTRASGAILKAALSDGELGAGESVCNGDSGGPLLDPDGKIVGVVSRIASNGSVRCVDTPVVYSAAWRWQDLVTSAR